MFITFLALMVGVFFGVGFGRSFEKSKIKEQLVVVDGSNTICEGRWDSDNEYLYRIR